MHCLQRHRHCGAARIIAWSALFLPIETIMTRDGVLDTALRLVNGDRKDEYGCPHAQFEAVAAMWSALAAEKLKAPLTAQDVGLFMCALKLRRAVTSPAHADSYVDIAGYAALTAEIVASQKE